MGHTPYGYRIENGIAVIDAEAAERLRRLYINYLSGMSLKKAGICAGIDACHASIKRLLMTQHYVGDDFYPAIIDEDIYGKAQEERTRRAAELGRLNKATQQRALKAPTLFSIKDLIEPYGSSNPAVRAEYIYGLIESEV